MRITIIGWYGTETIGDRAILAGLIYLFSKCFDLFEIKLGCLGTLLSDRTVAEDSGFYRHCSANKLKSIELFDSRYKKNLDDSISWADLVVVGGGPLMDIEPMYMLQYALKKSKSYRKKSIVAGCGMGPLKTEKFKKIATNIIDLSDLTIFRDNKSLELYRAFSYVNNRTYSSIDPGVFATKCYQDINKDIVDNDNYIAINFRQPPVREYEGLGHINDDFFIEFLSNFLENNSISIRLVPMSTNWMGWDDRLFLNRICRKVGSGNISVYNKPLSLIETMRVYSEADYCIGMRFHAVLLQTLLNGKNYVMDYTDPRTGKIIGLLNQLGLRDIMSERYFSLIDGNNIPQVNLQVLDKIIVDNNMIADYENVYVDNISKLVFEIMS